MGVACSSPGCALIFRRDERVRPGSCCSHVAAAPAAIKHRPSWARCPRPHSSPHLEPATAWQRARRLAGRCLHAVPRHDGRQLPRFSVRAPSAAPEVQCPSHDELHLRSAGHPVRRAVAGTPRLLCHRREVDLLEVPAHMVTHTAVRPLVDRSISTHRRRARRRPAAVAHGCPEYRGSSTDTAGSVRGAAAEPRCSHRGSRCHCR